ncbi:MAG: PAS domain-containing protein [Actinomycetota bacterium]
MKRRSGKQPRRGWVALRDLLLISLAVAVLLWYGASTSAFEGANEFLSERFRRQEGAILVGLILVSVGLALFSFLQWRSAGREAAARRRAEVRFRTLVEKMPAVTYTWDPREPAGSLPPPYVSPQVEPILGFSVEEWKADPKLWIQQIHPEDRSRVVEASNRADRRGEPFGTEYRHIKPDGSVIWVREEAVVVERDAAGNPSLVQGLMYDVTERKRAEEHVAQAEARYRTLVERVPAVTYTWDATYRSGEAPASYISPQVRQLLGYGQDEFGDPTLWNRLIHPEDAERVMAEWEACEKGDTAFRAEYRMFTHDGETIWIRDEAVPVGRDEQGHPLFQGVVFDITERKAAEDKVRATELRYRSLVEHMPVVTYLNDYRSQPEQRYISPGIEQLLGYSQSEWLADAHIWHRAVHPEDRERVLEETRRAEATGDPRRSEYRMIGKDSRVVWVHDDARIVEAGPSPDRSVWQGVCVDVTGRKEAEIRLREAEETYRTLVEQLPVVVYQDAIDDTSTALYISPQYERMFGFPPEARMADPDFWLNHLHPDDRERVFEESKRTNETGEPFSIEYRFIGRDGRVVWVRDEAVLLRYPDGRPKHWQGVLIDVTENKLAEETLSRRDAVLEAAGYAAERFLKSQEWEAALPEVLERLGKAAGAGRVYVFENERLDDESLAMSLRREWLAPGAPSLDGASTERSPYAKGFVRWQAALSAGRTIHGLTRNFPAGERTGQLNEGVQARVVVPVFVGDEWWGFIGFDDCERERDWPAPEIEALKTAADTLGAAIGRARAEELRDQAEHRYRTLVESIPAVTYIQGIGPEAPITYMSPQLEPMIGYTLEEWQPPSFDRWLQSLHPDDRERVVAADQRSEDTGEPFVAEYRQRHKNGSWVWIHDEAVLINDDQGQPLYWQGIRFDITPQKTAQQGLRDAEERYRSLVESMPAVTYIDTVEDPWSTVYVSPQIEALFGYSQEEWRDPSVWSEALHPDDAVDVRAAVDRHNREGVPYDIEYRLRAKDGRWTWVSDHANIVRDDAGKIRFSQGVMLDVTERRQAEEQLREAEARYRAIVEHVPAAIYVDRPDGTMKTVYVSPQIEEIMGVSPQRYLEEPDLWLDLMTPEFREEMRRDYLESIAQHLSWRGEYQIVTPDGREVWVHDETAFVMDEDGAPLFIQGVMFDVTERKLAEQALQDSERREREAAERLRALDEMKNTFLAAVSHELRSPLTSILGLSLTLEQQKLSVADRRDLTRRVAQNARKLDRLLKDLLDIDRLSRGNVTPQLRSTDVGALVLGTVESLELGERRVTVEAEAVSVPVDGPKIERIVENLVMNAVRHTEPDVSVSVRVWAGGGGAFLAVEDDGPGVPEELQAAIFEPFRQGPTASAHSPGTGIGLSLVAMFTELHGGRAWVEQREGGGASFRVFLPGDDAAPADAGEEHPVPRRRKRAADAARAG